MRNINKEYVFVYKTNKNKQMKSDNKVNKHANKTNKQTEISE